MSLNEGNENPHLVRSPVAGTLLLAAGPREDPYVNVGDLVRAGQTLCDIHTMGSVREIPGLPADYSGHEMVEVIHEIAADAPGEVVEVLVENTREVEQSRPLFRIRFAGRGSKT